MLFIDSSVGIILSYERNWLSLLLGKEKMTFALTSRDLINHHAPPMHAPVVDGNNDCKDIAALFASNFSNLLNRHSSLPRTSLFSSVQSSLTESDLTKLRG